MQYTPNKNLIWLLLRPWILFPRVIYILLTILFFVLRLLFQGSSKDKKVQKDLSKYLFNVISSVESRIFWGINPYAMLFTAKFLLMNF